MPQDSNFAVNLPLALHEPHLRHAVCDPALVLAGVAPVAWDPNRSFDFGASETALGFDGLEGVFPVAGSPALAEIVPDPPDFRDLPYRPSLGIARPDILPEPEQLPPAVGDQKGEPSCAGFALATAINIELMRAGRAMPVSERMLYEMARLNDEWADDETGGTSLRGAIKGFYHNGVCSSELALYHPGQRDWTFSIKAAKEARGITLGAYYRLNPSIPDFQAALNEVGAIVVSAHVHSGWVRPKNRPIERIPFRKGRTGTHAFAIVGYDEKGFVILNSWGPNWSDWEGRPGLAHWSYQDWGENMIDAWVLRLAPSAPTAFNVVARARRDEVKADERPPPLAHLPVPRRNKLVGHVVQAERDGIVGAGRTGMTLPSLRETALFLRSDEAQKKYPVLLFFIHDPFLGIETLTRLCGHLVDPLKKAGIYPIHILYGLDEVETVRLRIMHEAAAAKTRMAGSGEAIDDFLERRALQTCGRLLSAFAEGAIEAAKEGGPLWQIATSVLIEAAENRRCAVMSAGIGSLVADAMQALDRWPDLQDFPDADLRLVPVTAAPVRRKEDVVWSVVGPDGPEPELSGYGGSWQKLIGSVLDASSDRLGPSATLHPDSTSLDQVLASAKFLRALEKALAFKRKSSSGVAGR